MYYTPQFSVNFLFNTSKETYSQAEIADKTQKAYGTLNGNLSADTFEKDVKQVIQVLNSKKAKSQEIMFA
ncbi:MAG TPA: hypothetical protein PLQ36_03345, partial [Candidatus Gracilibacteria bacterium]|nr:hypothetical protein [Candidatus Gracilibacteria bacterium]